MVTGDGWPSHGPWIVTIEYGTNELFIEKAKTKHITIQREAKIQNEEESVHTFKVKNSFSDLTGINAVVLEGLSKNDLKSIDAVVSVYPDLPVYPAAYSWGIDRVDQTSLPLSYTYNPAFKGCGVDIYIIDSGIDTNHIEFASVSGVSRTVSNIFNQFGAVTSNTDGFGHGTHCAGTAGGNTIGTAPCANIYGLKIFDDSGGSGYSSYIVNALNVVKERHVSNPNAKSVVSMSLAGYCGTSCADYPVIQAISSMYELGILFSVAASNNNNANACLYFPAASPQAVTVAASDQYDNFASYSNTGPCVDIIGPGSYVNSACSYCSDESSYVLFSGTSMATPHVAGTLAQLLQKKKVSYTTAPDIVKAALICDAIKNKIQGIFPQSFGTAVNLLLQVPKNDSNFGNCFPTAEPTLKLSSFPSKSTQPVPTFPPSLGTPSNTPTFKPTTVSSFRPSTSAPSFQPSGRPSITVSQIPTITSTSKPSSRRPSYVPSAPIKPSPSAAITKIPTYKPTTTPSVEPTILPTIARTSIVPTSSPLKNYSLLICQDGGYCRSSSDCVLGNKCVGNYPGFTKCQADTSTYRTDSSCVYNWGMPCTADSQCCDPGAFCGNGPYRVCQQPSLFSGLCLDPGNFPTLKPISFLPTSQRKDYSNLICQEGGYCRSSTDCVPGNQCVGNYPGFTKCQADTSTYRTGNCLSNYGLQCTDDSQCCDPGAICGSGSYRVCQQLNYLSGLCLNPGNFPTLKPISFLPTSQRKDYSNLICQEGGYCRSSTDCVPGNQCVGNYPGFTKCQADTSTYRTGNCLSNYGLQCTDDSQCCDPGAICGSGSYRVCQQLNYLSGLCLNPSGFSLRTPTSTTSVTPSTTLSTAPFYDSTNRPTTRSPSNVKTTTVSRSPSAFPTIVPSLRKPSISPTTRIPSIVPSLRKPSISPTTRTPSIAPTIVPSLRKPSISPTTRTPSIAPSIVPSLRKPSISPTTRTPSIAPSIVSSLRKPSISPTTRTPSIAPSIVPSLRKPSISPTTRTPSIAPSIVSSLRKPSISPTTRAPSRILPVTAVPSRQQTPIPSTSAIPSFPRKPSTKPSIAPSNYRTSLSPSFITSTVLPSFSPRKTPTSGTTSSPTSIPSKRPTIRPSVLISSGPSFNPTTFSSSSILSTKPTPLRSTSPQSSIPSTISTASTSATQTTAAQCTDIYPYQDGYSCVQQASWGQCSQSWLQSPYCDFSCGRCGCLCNCPDYYPYNDGYTCQQQASWGKCADSFMQTPVCMHACGRCGSNPTPTAVSIPTPIPAVSQPPAAPVPVTSCGNGVNTTNKLLIHNGKSVFLSGINVAWGPIAPFGQDINYLDPNCASTTCVNNRAYFTTLFSTIASNGGNSIRFWLHPDGSPLPVVNNDYTARIIAAATNTQIASLLFVLNLGVQYNVMINFCLWSFDMVNDNGYGIQYGRWNKVLTDTTVRNSYLNDWLTPIALTAAPYMTSSLLSFEVFNEPEGMTTKWGWTNCNSGTSDCAKVDITTIQRMANLVASTIHNVDSNIKVTVGSWSYQALSNVNGAVNIWSDANLIAAGGAANGVLDYYQIHFYNGFGSTWSPIQNFMPVWQTFDKPHVIGELPNDPYPYTASSYTTGSYFYEKLLQNCYSGSWGWVYCMECGGTGSFDRVPYIKNMNYMKNKYGNLINVYLAPTSLPALAANGV
eukprot:gene27191-35921_t